MPGLLWMFALVSAGMMALSWLVAWWKWREGETNRGAMWPLADDWFADLTHYDKIFPLFHTRAFFTGAERFAYPAPSAVVYDGVVHMGPHRVGLWLGTTLVLAAVAAVLFGVRLVREGLRPGMVAAFVGLSFLGSWPLLFLYERANLEMILVVLTMLGSLCFWRGRMGWAAVLWGLAAAMKIYPAVLLVLLAWPGRWRAFAAGAVTMVGTLLLSWAFVGPTVAVAAVGTLNGIGGFVGSYATHTREWELRHDHSFLAFFKEPMALHSMHLSTNVDHLSLWYFVTVAVVLPVLYVWRFRRLPELNRYLLVMIAMVTLPPVSFDYTLMHLYFGFGLLVLLLLRVERRGGEMAVLRPVFWCMVLVFASENFVFYLGFHPNGMIKAVALFALAVLLLRHGLEERASEPGSRTEAVAGGRTEMAGVRP